MKRAIAIEKELSQIRTVEDLTEVFEGIASVKISRIRNKVIASKAFFSELWQTYSSIRINPREQLKKRVHNERSAYLAITSEGKLSGDIAAKVVDQLADAVKDKDLKLVDIFIMGSSGGDRLRYHGLASLQTFRMSESDSEFDVSDVIETLSAYEHISVFYQTYESLRVQRVARIELVTAVQEMSTDNSTSKTDDVQDIVSSKDYIFEPSVSEIAKYLESLMLGVALAQILMESRLAQYAARFNAMNLAKHRAHELKHEYSVQFYRAKRSEADERLKESMKLSQGAAL